jgi:hypothetical protein
MAVKNAKKVDFKRLAAALNNYRFAYLVTVDNEYRVHTVTVEPELRDGDPATPGSAKGCLHDCVVFSQP